MPLGPRARRSIIERVLTILKLKRRVVEERHRALIDALYQGAA